MQEWQERYQLLVARHVGEVYSTYFFSPKDPAGCFEAVLRSQMAGLYPLSHCVETEQQEGGLSILRPTAFLGEAVQNIFTRCDTDGDGRWLANDWVFFWKTAFQSLPTAAEAQALAEDGLMGADGEQVLLWYLGLVKQGRGHLLWRSLRSFGFGCDHLRDE
eukprot:TRINITY_DN63884_c0_g1_i2.p2 TRINITY_DN63884_c0_g1~~TRINITY_DN63884_c0_g1_i2.p2  ORF type:complete len:161 (-),score=42.28 TRINITY_DN63884_c0_g1_i2:15-497(-)